MIYQGSLITRKPASRDTLQRLIVETQCPVFIDVNLRDPWWDATSVADMLKAARWAKLNDGELATVIAGTAQTDDGLKRAASEALARFELDAMVVTRGAEGAFITSAEETVSGKPPARRKPRGYRRRWRRFLRRHLVWFAPGLVSVRDHRACIGLRLGSV